MVAIPFNQLSVKQQGKMRARDDVQAGSGGTGGIVLPLILTDGALPQSAYSVSVQIGSASFPLQVDIGSSDLWVAASSCSTPDCNKPKARYDPSSSQPTGKTFSLQYLKGSVSGPIVRDKVSIGGYAIPNSAFSAATTVNNEPLSPDFAGLLGLALPSNSIIKNALAGTLFGGSTLMESLLATQGSSSAYPTSHFASLALERPGSDTVPSLLGIGMHPPKLVSDASKIKYTSLAGGVNGKFWNAPMTSLSVWKDGTEHPMTLPDSVGSFSSTTASLDSGVPVIVTTRAIANAMYGAIGIGPAADGNYYFPCSTPFNVSLSLGGIPVFLHPLDLATSTSTKDSCQGTIVADDSAFAGNKAIGDFILGVPFMRNIYTVMAYSAPDQNGIFSTSSSKDLDPRLGILSLTDPAIAQQEWSKVMVEHKSLGGSTPARSSTSNSPIVSTPLKVLAGVGAAVVLIAIFVFAFRCIWVRRRYRRTQTQMKQEAEAGARADPTTPMGGYEKGRLDFARMVRDSAGGGYALATMSSDATLRGSVAGSIAKPPSGYFPDMGYHSLDQRHTLVGHSYSNSTSSLVKGLSPGHRSQASEWGENSSSANPTSNGVAADDEPSRINTYGHERQLSDTPLLAAATRFPEPQLSREERERQREENGWVPPRR